VCLCDSLDGLTDALMLDQVRLWQLPKGLREIYFIGESYGYEAGCAQSYKRIQELEHECDGLYRLATQGHQAKTQRTIPPTYAQLCRIRGQHALAAQVEADWELLHKDKTISRQELIEQRRKQAK